MDEGFLELLWIYEHPEQWLAAQDAKHKVAFHLWMATGNVGLFKFLFAEVLPHEIAERLDIPAFINSQQFQLVGAQLSLF